LKLKLDENLGERGAALFRAAGHEVKTVPEQGLQGASDRTLISICRQEGRCLVTLNLNFSNPLVFRPGDYSGIAVLRLPTHSMDSDLWDACDIARTLTPTNVRCRTH
jgi:predicted nuclease of predicted toxin-antitoxin system